MKIVTKTFSFDLDSLDGVASFNVYHCPATDGPITYETPCKNFPIVPGQLTYNIKLPTDIPIEEGDTILGVATVDEEGNISDIMIIEHSFDFTPPMKPKNLRIF